MIYASLKPVHQWHNAHVVPVYLALALMTGALWLNALLQLWGQPSVVVAALAAFAIPLAAWLKERFWRFVDTTSARRHPRLRHRPARRGTVRALDFPHTGENYLLKEMGFAIARKHAIKLRRAALGAGFAIPLLLTLARRPPPSTHRRSSPPSSPSPPPWLASSSNAGSSSPKPNTPSCFTTAHQRLKAPFGLVAPGRRLCHFPAPRTGPP